MEEPSNEISERGIT